MISFKICLHRVPGHASRTFTQAGAGLLLAALLAPAALRADVVSLSDGRKFEGKILSQNDEMVRIDTKVEGVRVILGLKRFEIKSIEKKILPAGFFDPPPAEERISDAEKVQDEGSLYLEVPIVGEIGKMVFADAISPILIYARTHRIPNIVFVIDSAGGETDEMVAIYRLLKAERKNLKFYGIIRNCQGPALAVAVWCQKIFFPPGGTLTGVGGQTEPPKDPKDSKDEASDKEIVWSEIAYRVVKDTERTGIGAEVLRALLDPSVELTIWKDDQGALQASARPPEGAAGAKVIIRKEAGKPFQMTSDQFVAAGMPAFKGTAKDLGEVLKIPGWTQESDYGQRIMARVAADKEKKAKTSQASFEAKVKKSTSQREETESYIQHNLEQAAQVDPTKGSYTTYSDHWNSQWGWGGGSNPERWTKESQEKWKTRTDACMYYLKNAGKGLRTMKRLDAEAVKLGLEPTFKPGEIDNMLKDLELKFNALQAYRNREGE